MQRTVPAPQELEGRVQEGNLYGRVGHETSPSSYLANAFLSCLWMCLLRVGD